MRAWKAVGSTLLILDNNKFVKPFDGDYSTLHGSGY